MLTYAHEIDVHGKPLMDVLDDIYSALSALDEKVAVLSANRYTNSLNSNAIEHKGSVDLDMVSREAAVLAGRQMSYGVKDNGDNTVLEFDMSDALKDLPPGASVTKTMVAVSGAGYGKKTSILNTKQPGMQIEVPKDKYPLTIDAKAIINTDAGDIQISRVITVDKNDGADIKKDLDVKELSNRQASTYAVGDVLDQAMLRIKKLENKISAATQK